MQQFAHQLQIKQLSCKCNINTTSFLRNAIKITTSTTAMLV